MFGYELFKFLHVAGTIVWIGTAVFLSLLNLRFNRIQDRELVVSMNRQIGVVAGRLFAPAAGLTLLCGVLMMILGHLRLEFWIIWGLAVILVTGILGGGLLERVRGQLMTALTASEPAPERIVALRRRINWIDGIDLILLFSAVWVMVFKPVP